MIFVLDPSDLVPKENFQFQVEWRRRRQKLVFSADRQITRRVLKNENDFLGWSTIMLRRPVTRAKILWLQAFFRKSIRAQAVFKLTDSLASSIFSFALTCPKLSRFVSLLVPYYILSEAWTCLKIFLSDPSPWGGVRAYSPSLRHSFCQALDIRASKRHDNFYP